jgi:hypothetical protein
MYVCLIKLYILNATGCTPQEKKNDKNAFFLLKYGANNIAKN